ncbi:MAG: sugar phosphate isomerase/epimerase family protein, partial [Pirellulales bacterium]
MSHDPRGIEHVVSRRAAISAALATAGGAAAFGQAALAAGPVAQLAQRGAASPKRYPMKKSINLWAFPYPERMNLEQCLRLAKEAGFDGIELNYDLENDLSPKSGTKEYTALRKLADKIGIEISGLCSFLFWPYPLTSGDEAKRARGLELAGLMTQAAADLGVENLLVVPGAVHIPWRTDYEPVPNDVCDQRARQAIA